ncbi:cupin domain-containing protein [Methanochimaera problematica]|nr:cupin domain-containing protein [Methanoplanus sp. FWC-SCC4]
MKTMIIKRGSDIEDYRVKKDDIKGLWIKFFLTSKDSPVSHSLWTMEFEPHGYAKMHRHKESHYVYVVEGRCTIRSPDGEEETIGKGDVAYVPSCEFHEFVNPDNTVLKIISFMPILEGATGKSTTGC